MWWNLDRNSVLLGECSGFGRPVCCFCRPLILGINLKTALDGPDFQQGALVREFRLRAHQHSGRRRELVRLGHGIGDADVGGSVLLDVRVVRDVRLVKLHVFFVHSIARQVGVDDVGEAVLDGGVGGPYGRDCIDIASATSREAKEDEA